MVADLAAPTAFEQLKGSSRGLAGTLAHELAADTPAFSDDAAQLLKFHGSYQQDDRDTRRARGQAGLDRDYRCMVRAGIPGGVVTGEQYLALDKLADTVGNATLRVTTRQGLQYHFVRKGDLRPLIGELNANLVTTLAACGDVARNVMCCPAPPANAAEAEVQAKAVEVSRAVKPSTSAYWQLWVDGERAVSAEMPQDEVGAVDPLYGSTYLPRKFKIGFAFPGDNCIDVYTQDVGIVPMVRGERVVSYTLVVGGGLGMTHNKPETYPRLGDPLGAIDPDGLVEAVKVVIGMHRDLGDRADRKHARLKYVVEEMGVAAFRAEFDRRLGRELQPPAALTWPRTDDHLGWRRQVEGGWTLGVRIPSGRIQDNGVSLRTALRLAVEKFSLDVRFTPRQDVLLTDIDAADRDAVADLLREHRVALLEDIAPVDRFALACPALPTCGLALAEAERALPDLLGTLRSEMALLGLGAEAVHVRMTGCPNGCARPYSTEVGIVGRGKDHYTVYLGGDAEGTRLNTEYVDRVPAGTVAAVLSPVLAAFRTERQGNEPFGDYCHRIGIDTLRDRFRPDELVPRRRPQRTPVGARSA
ncbi:MAG: NADPH-dependent assimilatory sulfite reductase hemoprotein subunit [Nitriliruptorales bacterium]|nr:NADPH-dependent assimilatory sulfite reductase hemoprotein subunit [Nitriliruptorales bacterium]